MSTSFIAIKYKILMFIKMTQIIFVISITDKEN